MNLADTHAHLYWDSFEEDFDQMIQRALDAQVTYLINVGVDVKTSKKALEQVKTYPWPKGLQVYSTIGIHPHDVSENNDVEKLEEIWRNNKNIVVAIGECGLDYKEADEQARGLQRQLFQAQIDLAKKLNLPLIVHCRDDRSKNPQNSECWDEVVEMTKDHFGIYHCYSGLPSTTQIILKSTNFLVSFAGNLTYPKNDYLKEAVQVLPLERITTETDCPFLPPQSKRGQRNEPANVLEIAQLIADLKGLSLKEVAKQTSSNAKKLLKLNLLSFIRLIKL